MRLVMITRKELNSIYEEIKPALGSMGCPRTKNNSTLKVKYNCGTQFLYGDVLDWLRDMHPELRNKDYDDDLAATYIIGLYTISNTLL
jgi:hypothetical protein